jgi:hypothetical protein
MANEEHLALLKQGVEAWNAWREAHAHVTPNLAGAELDGAVLANADLSSANFRMARALSARTESIWDSQRAVVVIQTGCWVEEASDE